LIQPGFCRRVHSGAKGIHIIKTVVFQGAHVPSEKGENQRLLGLEDLETQEGNPARQQPDRGDDQQGDGRPAMPSFQQDQGEYKTCDGRCVQNDEKQQERHAVFLIDENLLFHEIDLLNYDIKMISYKYDVVNIFPGKSVHRSKARDGLAIVLLYDRMR